MIELHFNVTRRLIGNCTLLLPILILAVLWFCSDAPQLYSGVFWSALASWAQAVGALLAIVVALYIYWAGKRDQLEQRNRDRAVRAVCLAGEMSVGLSLLHMEVNAVLTHMPENFDALGLDDAARIGRLTDVVKMYPLFTPKKVEANADKLFLFETDLGTTLADVISTTTAWQFLRENPDVIYTRTNLANKEKLYESFRSAAASVNRSTTDAITGLHTLMRRHAIQISPDDYIPKPLPQLLDTSKSVPN